MCVCVCVLEFPVEHAENFGGMGVPEGLVALKNSDSLEKPRFMKEHLKSENNTL